MARESAGSVYVVIDGDASPLIAKYAQAEAASRAAGQRIASGLGQGLSSSKQIVDAYGVAFTSGVTKPIEQAVIPIARTTVAIKAMGEAAEHTVPQMAAMSGAVRVLSGEQSIRAVERLGVSVFGLGAAAQAAFPLIGAIAVGELLTRAYEKFSKVSESEKAATEQAKQFTSEIKTLDTEVESLRVRFETMKNGAQAGLKAELTVIGEQVTEAARQLQNAKDTLRGGTEQTIGGRKVIVPAHISSIQRTPQAAAAEIAGLQLEKAQEEGNLKLAEIQKKREEEIKLAAAAQRTAFKEKYDNELADMKAAHEVTRAEELAFRRRELVDAKSHGTAFASISTEVNRQVGTLSQEVRKQDADGSHALAMAQVEYASRLRKEAISELEADGRLMGAAVEKITKEQDAAAAARKSAADIADRAGKQARQYLDVSASGSGEADKLRLQIAYEAQVVHTKQQQIDYAVQLGEIESATAQEKLRAADADVVDAKEALALNPSATQLLQLQQAITAQKKAQSDLDNQALRNQGRKNAATRAGQIGSGLAGIAGNIPSQLGGALAGGITGGNIGQQIKQALTGIGKEMLGDVFKDLIASIVGNSLVTLANTASVELNTFWLAIKSFVGGLLGFASGGRPAPGVPYIVGENGPEVRIDDGPGVILPNVPNFSGGSGVSQMLTASMVSNSSSNAMSIGAIHLHGVQNVEQFARRLPAVLKSRAPVFSPATR